MKRIKKGIKMSQKTNKNKLEIISTQGPITFIINKTKARTKLIGKADCGFRSFAYVGDHLSDAKRSIVNDYKNRSKL